MDIGRAFSYVFDDEQWLTVILVGGLLLIIPIFGWFVLIGFTLEAARNIANGSPRPLPKWDNLGEKFSQGFAGFAISFVYAIPIIILAGLFACVAVLGAAAAGDSEAAGAGVGLLSLCLTPLMILIALVIQPLILVGFARYLQTGSLGAALRFGEAWATLRADPGTWLVLWLLQIVCGFVGSLGSVAFGVGALFTTVYSQAVFGHLLGQVLSRSAQPSGGEISYTPPPAF